MKNKSIDMAAVRERLVIDRDRITGLYAAAEIMRNHAEDAETEACRVRMKRDYLVRRLRETYPDQSDEMEALFAVLGIDQEDSGTIPRWPLPTGIPWASTQQDQRSNAEHEKAARKFCGVCGEEYELHESPTGTFRSHFVHPADDHEAIPS